jgi:hypothetical protein
MKVLLEIDNSEEIEKFSQFVKELEESKSAEKAEIRKKVMVELKKKMVIHLPPNYKFNRDELHVRPGLR